MSDSPLREPPPSSPRPRRVGLTVRGLMGLVLLVGGGFAWLTQRAHEQRDAVAEIRGNGGRVIYDWQLKRTGTPLPTGTPDYVRLRKGHEKWPRWLLDRLGPDYLGHPQMVGLGHRATDADLAHVAVLRRVELLGLDRTKVTDAGLARLPKRSALTRLGLSDTGITDAGLVHLADRTALETLDLDNTAITDAGLKHLRGLKNLRVLGLGGTRVTDAGLVHLQGLKELRLLTLKDTAVTDVGIAGLKRTHPRLTVIR